jgi:hypothetical protein
MPWRARSPRCSNAPWGSFEIKSQLGGKEKPEQRRSVAPRSSS